MIENGEDILVQVRASLDKVESFRNESFLPEEIMMYVNKSQSRLLDDLVNKNFEQGTLRYEWIRPFLKEEETAGLTWTLLRSSVTLPVDMTYLIGVRGIAVISGTETSTFESGCKTPLDISGGPPYVIPNAKKGEVQVRVAETGEAIDQSHNSFYGSKNVLSPIAEAKADSLTIFRDNSYILEDVTIDYTGQLAPIVDDTADIVWPSAAAQVIVDYTVEYMRLSIGDPAYQGNVNDLNLRTQNVVV